MITDFWQARAIAPETGLDVNAGRVETAHLENNHQGVFKVSDPSALVFSDNSLDRTLVFGRFQHDGDATAHSMLAEFARMLKADGKLILQCFTSSTQSFPQRMGLDFLLETHVNPRKA